MDARLAALAEASARIFGAQSLGETLRLVAEEARAIAGAHQCVAALAGGADASPPMAAASLSEKYAAWRSRDAAAWAADAALLDGGESRRLRLSQRELEAHPAFARLGAGGRPPPRGWLAAPLVARDGSRLGLVQLSDKQAGDFDADDEAMLVQVARLGATAIDNVRRLEALGGAARRFHEFAEIGSEVLWETGPDHRYTLFLAKGSFRMNAAPQSYLGKTRWEAAGADPHTAPWAAHIAELNAHRPIRNFEYAVTTRRDGAMHFLRVNANPIFDAAGRFLGYRGATSNVTDLRRAEAAARASEDRFRRFASIASDWLWETDAEHRFVFFGGVSATLDERPYGKTRWEIAGADPSAPAWRAHFADLEARRPFRKFEYTRRDASGRLRYVSVSGDPKFDEDGTFRGYLGTASEITAQREAEAEARKAAEQYRNIVETANEGVWLVDAEVKTTFVNRRMAEMLGYAPEEIIGRSVYDFRPPEDRVQRESRWAERKRGVAEQREARFVRRDGTVFWAQISAQPLFDAERKFLGSLGMVTDITQRKAAEAALKASQDRFRDFAQVGSDWLWETDTEHRFTFVDGPAAVIGRSLDGLTRWEVAKADPDDPLWRRHRADLDLRLPFRNFEYTAVDTEGRRRHLLVSGKPLFADDGAFLGYRGTTTDITAQREAEAKAREADEQFRRIVSTANEGLWISNRDARLVFANRRVAEMFGYQPEEMLGKEIFDFIPPDRLDEVRRHWRERKDGKTDRFEARHLRKDGSQVWALVSTTPRFDAAGEFSGAITMFIDISDRKRAEAALRASEDRFRDFAEIASDWVWETDAEHRISYISGASVLDEDPLGRTRWHISGAEPGDPAWREHLADLEARRPFRDFEYTVVGKGGRVHHLVSSGRPKFDEAGRFLGYRGTTTDRTAQREAEAKARASEEKFGQLVETANEGVWIVDAEMRTTYVNRRVPEMLGYAPEEIVGRAFVDFKPEKDRAATLAVWREKSRTGLEPVETRMRRKDGSTLWVLMSAVPHFDGERKFTGVFAMMVDITERKRAEAALAASERRFRDFASVASDWFWETDAEHRFSYFSPSRDVSQPDPSTGAIGLTRWAYARADLAEPKWQAHLADLEARRPFRNFEYEYRRPDGSRGVSLINGLPVFAANGAFLGYRGTATDITDRKRAEQAAAQAKREVDMILAGISDGCVALDNQGRFIYANAAAERLCGRRAEDFVGRTAAEVLGAEPDGPFQTACDEAKQLGAPIALTAYSTIFGLWIEARAHPNPDGLTIFFRDVSEERRVHLALAESERRLRAALEENRSILASISDGFIALDNEWRFTFINNAAERMWGIHKEGMLGKTLIDALNVDATNTFHRNYLDSKRTGEPTAFTAYSDIFQKWLEVRGYPHPRGYTIFFHDVSEQRRAHRALLKSMKKLESAREMNERIIDASFDLVISTDRRGDVLRISQRCQSIWGYRPDELVGRNLGELMHPDDVEPVRQISRSIIAGHPPRHSMTRFLRRDGSVAHMQWSAVWSERDQEMLVIGRDVTEQLKAEERLNRAQRLEAVGQLTGGIAHDFNNLLTVIMGNSDMLARALKDQDKLRRRAELCLEAARRAAELTGQLLAFARRQTLAPKVVEPNKLVTDLLDLVRRTLGAQIEIALRLDEAPWRCKVDATQLETALLNLALNARDAMPEGGTLTIATSHRTLPPGGNGNSDLAGGDYVVIDVCDTGTGMSPEVLARAFEPFFTTKDIGKGSGLGLAMVYGFVKQSGGHVAIESEPGRGTKVSLFLPRAAEPAAAAAPAPHDDAPLPGGRETVLVVEDDPAVRDFVTESLRRLGYRVLVAGNGSTARNILFGGEKVDLLFTDIMMPGGVTGTQLAAEVEARLPGLPILFTTGYADAPALPASAGRAGVSLLRKPYKTRELALSVRSALHPAR